MNRVLALIPIFILLSGEQALVLLAPLPLTLLMIRSLHERQEPVPIRIAR